MRPIRFNSPLINSVSERGINKKMFLCKRNKKKKKKKKKKKNQKKSVQPHSLMMTLTDEWRRL